jgi:hypothetical protein
LLTVFGHPTLRGQKSLTRKGSLAGVCPGAWSWPQSAVLNSLQPLPWWMAGPL